MYLFSTYGASVPIPSEECAEGSVCIDEGGCAECGENQYYEFDLQKNRAGTLRLHVDTWIQCQCNLCPGESPERLEEDGVYFDVVETDEEEEGGGSSPES